MELTPKNGQEKRHVFILNTLYFLTGVKPETRKRKIQKELERLRNINSKKIENPINSINLGARNNIVYIQ